jgi:hypothetical protein
VLVVALADRSDLNRFSQWLCADEACPIQIRVSPVLDQVKPAISA